MINVAYLEPSRFCESESDLCVVSNNLLKMWSIQRNKTNTSTLYRGTVDRIPFGKVCPNILCAGVHPCPPHGILWWWHCVWRRVEGTKYRNCYRSGKKLGMLPAYQETSGDVDATKIFPLKKCPYIRCTARSSRFDFKTMNTFWSLIKNKGEGNMFNMLH